MTAGGGDKGGVGPNVGGVPQRSRNPSVEQGRNSEKNPSSQLLNVNNNGLELAEPTAREAAFRALSERGISNPASVLALSTPTAALGWCRWWDRQRDAGPGLLALKVRSGAPPPAEKLSMEDEQRRYCDQICDWLNRHFPDLTGDRGLPHPAAFVAVTHLHHKFGKGALTAREHGSEIRAAVSAWEAKWAAA